MTNLDASWSLTDDALVLILHAEKDIIEDAPNVDALTGMRPGQLGGTKTDELWRRETAVLRLISTVEAYTDAASKYYFTQMAVAPPKPPFTWSARHQHYKKKHAIDLKACDGWDQVGAGIDLRNCLAHGLGSLTETLLSDASLGKRMRHIDVHVGGNRMHSTEDTVPKLASGCRRFVVDIERRLVTKL